MKNKSILLILGLTVAGVAMFVGCSTNGDGPAHEGHDHASHSHETTGPALATTEDTLEVKPYLQEKCLVSGEALGSMGEPTVLTYKGQEIKLCCDDCVEGFNKDPEKYLVALNSSKALEDRVHDHGSLQH
jgi:hypothetical protein